LSSSPNFLSDSKRDYCEQRDYWIGKNLSQVLGPVFRIFFWSGFEYLD